MKKLTLEEMRSIAGERNGKCLSTKYINSTVKLEWQCSKGHKWTATPNAIKRGSWCPKCAGSTPLTIEEMHQIAKKRSGKCLSKNYVNSDTKLEWQCSEGHKWKAAPDNIKAGKWCPKCAGRAPLTIEEMHQIAEERNGKCLSTECINAKAKLKWQCSEGHKWEANPNSIKRESWCPKCAGRKRWEKRRSP